MILVPDASVILNWCLTEQEADRDKAIAIRDLSLSGRVQLWVPSLWRYEAGNILARRKPDDADELLSLCETCGLREIPPSSKWQSQAIRLVIEYGVSFYDASYHALALVSEGRFVTADKRYIAKVEKAGSVIHLADFAA